MTFCGAKRDVKTGLIIVAIDLIVSANVLPESVKESSLSHNPRFYSFLISDLAFEWLRGIKTSSMPDQFVLMLISINLP